MLIPTAIEQVQGGGGVLYAATRTTDLTVASTTEGSPTAVLSLGSQTYAALPITIDFYCPAILIGGTGLCILEIWADSTYLCRLWDFRSNAADQQAPASARFPITPSAGSHTYEIRAFKGGGAGTVVMSGGTGTGGSVVYAPMLLTASL